MRPCQRPGDQPGVRARELGHIQACLGKSVFPIFLRFGFRRSFLLIFCVLFVLQVLKATSRKKFDFHR